MPNRDILPDKLVHIGSVRGATTVVQQRNRLPSEEATGELSSLLAIHQRLAAAGHGDMPLTRAEFREWHRAEHLDDLLAQLALVLDRLQPARSGYWSIGKALLGVVLLAGAAAAGAYGGAIVRQGYEFFGLTRLVAADPASTAVVVGPVVRHANEFFMPAAVPGAAGPASTAAAAGPALVAPAAITQEAQAPVAQALVAQVPMISLEDGVAAAVDQMRSSLPKKIDAVTTVVGVKSEGSRIIYENKIAIDAGKIDDAKKSKMVQMIVANTCNTPGPRKLLDLGVSLRYVYFDMKAQPMLTADVTKQSCV